MMFSVFVLWLVATLEARGRLRGMRLRREVDEEEIEEASELALAHRLIAISKIAPNVPRRNPKTERVDAEEEVTEEGDRSLEGDGGSPR